MRSRRTYLVELERFFSVMRMGGFSLAPKDLETAERWYEEGVPLEVVIRGVTEGMRAFLKDRPDSRPPHRLGWYGKRIRSHIKVFRKEEEPVWQELDRPLRLLLHRIAELELLIQCEERRAERELKEEALRGLRTLHQRCSTGELDEAGVARELSLLDGEILRLYHHRLSAETAPDALSPPEREEMRSRLGLPELGYWRR